MKEQGIDLVDCSSGGVVNIPIDVYPGYKVQLAESIRKEANIPTGAVGLITTGIQSEEILTNEFVNGNRYKFLSQTAKLKKYA